jgi:C-terminal processing protease CtpA/Prc
MNMKKVVIVVCLLMVSGLILSACGPKSTIIPQPTETVPTGEAGNGISLNEPYKLSGTFTVSNGFVFESYFVENAVALVDMHGFVTRDNYWELPVDSQVLGFLNMDIPSLTGTWNISLPAKPQGVFNDVDNNGSEDAGVQIFAASYFPNFSGGPYSEGDDRSFGWPNYLASVKTDGTREYEVTGGKLVVWAPDSIQSFPSGFGADGLLFTVDDPVVPIPAGYSIVDLDQSPFGVVKETEPELMLFEPEDFAVKDFSNLSFSEAFEAMFEFVSTHYAFNGYPEIQPDWQKLYDEIKPRVDQAESDSDGDAFWLAMRDFTWAFKDGHVGLSSTEYYSQLFTQGTSGGYGFALRELDDGAVVVVFILEEGPADKAGMQVGAVVTEFNEKPINDAIKAVVPWTLPMSSAWDLRYQQVRYLLRAPLETEASLTFTNPGGQPQIANLVTISERDSFARTSRYFGVDTNPLLPVEFKILESGAGYVKVNSYYDDLNLLNRLFKRALDAFTTNEVPGIIIDLRDNGGGNPIGLAAYLTDMEIPMPQGYSYSESTMQFEKKGTPGRILPNVEQYRFDKMVLLVGPNCASACEDEAYSFSQVPGMIVVGMYPTSGTMADVGDGQINLPDGLSMQIPTERMILEDGSLFLQGQGVQPGLRVPVTLENVTSTEDIILNFAEKVVLLPVGAGIIPSAPPAFETDNAKAEATLLGGKASFLEDKARQVYEAADFETPGEFVYTINLSRSEELVWAYGWCAAPDKFDQNWEHISFKFYMGEKEVSADKLFKFEFDPESTLRCRYFYNVLSEWQGGENHLLVKAVFNQSINDGSDDFQAGEYIYDYTVYVKP